MDLMLEADEELVADGARKFFAEKAPTSELLNLSPDSVSRLHARNAALWGEFAALGWLGVADEPCDEAPGFGLAAQMLVARELGRALAPVTLLSTMIGVHVAAACDQPALAQAAMNGSERINAAVWTAGDAENPRRLMRCADVEAGYVLTFGPTRPVLLHRSLLSSGTTLSSIDPSTPLQLHSVTEGADASPREFQIARGLTDILGAAALIGISEAACKLAVDHALTRVQFGRPIGSFQAIKHRCAAMHLHAQAGFALLCLATAACRARCADWQFQALAALNLAHRTSLENVRHLIQILGAMGNTNEHPAHLYLGRTHLIAQIFCGDRLDRRLLLTR
jgi:alkylation response protein AidB-like acyl-CoA dehydrogenase